MPRSQSRIARYALVCCAAWLSAGTAALSAHEVPNDVTARMIVKPLGPRLNLLVRVPLEAMQDVNFPTFGPGYLDVARADTLLRDAAQLWLVNDIELYENGRRLGPLRIIGARASIPSDRSFTEYDSAAAHVRGPPLAAGTQLVWQQALLDVALETAIESENSEFALRGGLERLGLSVVSVIRYEAPGGDVRVLQVEDQTELVPLDPSRLDAALRFVRQGFVHILDGADHLLFLFCLVLPLRRRLGALVWVVTAFTVAHSITLIASAYGMAPDTLWFPPLIETLIAASIFYMAVENIVAVNPGSRWRLAFAFGLVHGFGFSFALRNTLQFAGSHELASLLSFNIGVELGQLLVLAAFVAGLNLFFRFVRHVQLGVIVLSVIVAHAAWHWMLERFDALRAYPLGWREVYVAVSGSGLGWLVAVLLILAISTIVRRKHAR